MLSLLLLVIFVLFPADGGQFVWLCEVGVVGCHAKNGRLSSSYHKNVRCCCWQVSLNEGNSGTQSLQLGLELLGILLLDLGFYDGWGTFHSLLGSLDR